MYTAIIPELMTISVFMLSLLCILAGKSPGYLQNYEVLYMNVTGLKVAYRANTSEILPIPDVYNVHLTTHCAGYYHDGFNLPLTNLSCSPVSSYTNFLPSLLIGTDLAHSATNATLRSLSFPPEIQSAFVSSYNVQLHVSYIFYVISLIFTSIAVLWGILAFIIGTLGVFTVIFTSSATLFLLISSAILTAVQNQATGMINLYGNGVVNNVGNGVGVMGGYGGGLGALTWTAFGLSATSSVVWTIAGVTSEFLRDSSF